MFTESTCSKKVFVVTFCMGFHLVANKEIIHLSLIIILIVLNGHLSGVLAATCDAVSGTTKTITASCSDLAIDGNGSSVTINSGITIDAVASSGSTAVTFDSATNTTFTNSGTISATNWALSSEGSSTINTLTNSGTIQATTDGGLWIGGTSTITTLTNSGTISAGDDYGLILEDTATVSTLTNSGTIQATGDDYGLLIEGSTTITTLTNSGTISAEDDAGLALEGSATITNLINSGTISAGDDYGMWNDGTATITTLTNTGTISAAGNGIGIWNGSKTTFTTLNNSQGTSSSALTFDGKLPTNYNVIANSIADYGKIVFSDALGVGLGTTNFGIHSSSMLAGSTTYSAVIKGLSSGDIASGTSGTFTSGGASVDWTLENSAGTTWDLVTAAATATDNTNTTLNTITKTNVQAGLNNVNYFANNNTYDCDLFSKNNICLSFGGRHTRISNPDTQLNSVVFVGGWKLSDTFRIGAFLHSNIEQNTPKNLSLKDKTPMLGGFMIFSGKDENLGYRVKFAYVTQTKKAVLRRPVEGETEKGRGATEIWAENFVAEVQYGHRLAAHTIVRPYLAYRQALITQDSYTETGISNPLTFNQIDDQSSTLLLGTKFDTVVTPQLTVKGSVGIEHDFIHTVNRIEPTGLTGLITVNLDKNFNRTRPVISAGWDYYLSSYERWSGIVQYQELPYQDMKQSNLYIYYTKGF